MNTVIYGAETWSITAQLEKKLSAFLHKAIRKILRINMYQVKDYRIRNEHLRNKMCLPDMIQTIRYRQFKFIGKTARQDDSWLPKRLLGAWAPTRRKVGRPQFTIRRTYANTLRLILGRQRISKDAPFAEWVHLAQDKKEWDQLGWRWVRQEQRDIYIQYGDHPLLGGPVLQQNL